ncbi:MAG: trigger factor [Bryobacteraceae bacterium]
MALIEGCKHSIEVTIPADAMAAEIEKVTEKVRSQARIQGFRPGKAPASIIRARYGSEIRQEALENLIPKYLEEACERENLRVVSRPTIKDLHFHEGEAVHFRAEFEVAPEIELKDVRGLKVAYAEPVVTEEEVEERLNQIRESRAEFVNIDPRPVEDGDHCLVSLETIAGVEGEPLRQDDINIEVGGKDTFEEFSNALRGAVPGDVREAEVTYPENYAVERLAGRTVRFRITLKQIRRKELPELNDEFARDLGDFQSIDEVREEIRKAIFREKDYEAQVKAKNDLVDQIVAMHDFPVPEAYIDDRIEHMLDGQLRSMQAQGVDISKIRIDWEKLKQNQYEQAKHDVKAALLLGRIAARENIHATEEEIDQEVQRIARQRREPVAAVRLKLEKEGGLQTIVNRIITDKTLKFLFDHAVKVPPETAAAAETSKEE